MKLQEYFLCSKKTSNDFKNVLLFHVSLQLNVHESSLSVYSGSNKSSFSVEILRYVYEDCLRFYAVYPGSLKKIFIEFPSSFFLRNMVASYLF